MNRRARLKQRDLGVTPKQEAREQRVAINRAKGWHLRWQLEGDGWVLWGMFYRKVWASPTGWHIALHQSLGGSQ